MRYLIDCTFVYQHPTHNFGIQRVVRNVFNNLGEINQELVLQPIVVLDGKIYAINQLPTKVDAMTPAAVKLSIHEAVMAMGRKRASLERKMALSNGIAKSLLNVLYQASILPLRVMFKLASLLEVFGERRNHKTPIVTGTDDVLLLLDSCWQYDYEDMLKDCKSRGTKIVAVVYDLIPLTHSQFCVTQLVEHFADYFQMIGTYADGYIAISKTIRDQLREHMQDKTSLSDDAFTYFYLGAELKNHTNVAKARKNIIRHSKPARMYLVVGTIEPRKNHAYLLDAFELLWADGEDVYLYIIGKVGWRCDELINRIKSHPEYEKRLVCYFDANDAELTQCYKAAKAVVFASHVEGFGLPLVEAYQHGTPVYASGIPVFREIGQGQTQYFDLDEPSSLANIIKDDVNYEIEVDAKWLTWRESTQQLIDATTSIVKI